MRGIYLGLGSNLGDREKAISEAKALIEMKAGQIIESSSLYESEPWGVDNQQNYLNQVVRIKTQLKPESLLKVLISIEETLGRPNAEKGKNQPRIIDLDILFYQNQMVDIPNLTIPHPKAHERNFVLVPMMEIADNETHPTLNHTIGELYLNCLDASEVFLYEPTTSK